MSNSIQILDGDQITHEENFYRVDHEWLTGDLFAVANLLVMPPLLGWGH